MTTRYGPGGPRAVRSFDDRVAAAFAGTTAAACSAQTGGRLSRGEVDGGEDAQRPPRIRAPRSPPPSRASWCSRASTRRRRTRARSKRAAGWREAAEKWLAGLKKEQTLMSTLSEAAAKALLEPKTQANPTMMTMTTRCAAYVCTMSEGPYACEMWRLLDRRRAPDSRAGRRAQGRVGGSADDRDEDGEARHEGALVHGVCVIESATEPTCGGVGARAHILESRRSCTPRSAGRASEAEKGGEAGVLGAARRLNRRLHKRATRTYRVA